MHWRCLALGLLVTTHLCLSTLAQLQTYPWCDVKPIRVGCESYVSDFVLLAAASDDLDAMPLQIISHPTPIAERLDEPHTTAQFAAYKSVAVVLELKTDNRQGEVSLDEKSGNLNLRADSEGGSVVFWSGVTNFSIDASTGCILINGSLPAKSPCRSSVTPDDDNENMGVNTSNVGGGRVKTDDTWWHNNTFYIAGAVITMSVFSLIIGILVGCIAGVRAERKRFSTMYPEIHTDNAGHDDL